MAANALQKLEPAQEVVAITPMQMLQVAVQQGADLDKLQKLMDLQDRWQATEARKAFVAAMNAFKADAPELVKNKHVKFDSTEYYHVGLDQVASVIGKGLSEHGLSHSWKTDQLDGGIIRVTCIITHVQGHSESVALQSSPDGSGKKNNIQAIGSAVSYLQRYTLLAATGLAARDQDDDGKKAEAVSEKQLTDLEALAEDVGANKAAFLKYLGVQSFADIPSSKYKDAVAALEKKRKARK